MTKRERTDLRRAIALLRGDYGWEPAMDILTKLHGPYTAKEIEEADAIEASCTENHEEEG